MPNLEWTIESRYHPDPPGPSQASEQYWNSPKVQAYFTAKDLEKSKLKKLVRAGIPDGLRGEIYAKILKLDDLAEYEKNYEVALTRTHGTVIPSEPLPPTFGGKSHAARLALNKIGLRTTEHIRCIIAHDFPALEYCPFITPCVELLAHHMRDEDELLGAMYAMIKRSTGRSESHSSSSSPAGGGKQHDEWGYFPIYRKGVKLMLRAFGNLLYTCNKKLHLHLTELHSASPDPVWADWLLTMLVGTLPQPLLWRMLDAFVLEGWKALFRFTVGMLLLQRDAILQQPDLPHVLLLLTPDNPAFTPPTALTKQADNVTVSRSDVRNLKEHHKTLAAISIDDHISEPQYRYQRGLPKLVSAADQQSPTSSSSVLTDEHWIALWSWIPPAKRVESLELIFTTKEHGTHVSNLFRRAEGRAPLILLVETTMGEVFGAYLSHPFPGDGERKGEWYGNGETFLFSLAPYAKLYPWIGRTIDFNAYNTSAPSPSLDDPEQQQQQSPSSATTDRSDASSSMLSPADNTSADTTTTTTTADTSADITASADTTTKTHTATGAATGNPPYSASYLRDRASMFLMVTSNKAIHVGGGGAHPGLYIQPSLTSGETGPCQTFENNPLTGRPAAAGKDSGRFECHVVEVFAFT